MFSAKSLVLACFFQILNLLKDLQNLDEDFKSFNIISDAKENYRRMRLEVLIAVILSVLLTGYVVATDSYTFLSVAYVKEVISDTMIYRVTLFCTSFVVVQFCVFLGVVRQRYIWLNRHIERVAKKCCKQITSPTL